jgi:transposase
MRRHELTDEQWELLKNLFPPWPGWGRPHRDRRQVLNGILWIVRTGAPWRDLPERYGPWKSIYHCFNQWRKDGTWDRILRHLQIRLDREGQIDWGLWCVDGSSIRASRAAAGAGEKGGQMNRKTTLWAAQEADLAANCTWLLTAEACRLQHK